MACKIFKRPTFVCCAGQKMQTSGPQNTMPTQHQNQAVDLQTHSTITGSLHPSRLSLLHVKLHHWLSSSPMCCSRLFSTSNKCYKSRCLLVLITVISSSQQTAPGLNTPAVFLTLCLTCQVTAEIRIHNEDGGGLPEDELFTHCWPASLSSSVAAVITLHDLVICELAAARRRPETQEQFLHLDLWLQRLGINSLIQFIDKMQILSRSRVKALDS